MYYSIFVILYCLHILLNQNRYKNKIIQVNAIKGFYFRKGMMLITSYFYDYRAYNTFDNYTIEGVKPSSIDESVSTTDYNSYCRHHGIRPKRVEGPFIYESFSSEQILFAYEPLKTITPKYEDLICSAKYDQLVWYIYLTLQYVVVTGVCRIGEFLYEENFSKN